MSQPKLKEEKTVKLIPMDSAIPLRKVEVSQPFNAPGIVGSDRSLLLSKYPGLKMWWSPVGVILERGGARAIVPQTNVIVAIIDE